MPRLPVALSRLPKSGTRVLSRSMPAKPQLGRVARPAALVKALCIPWKAADVFPGAAPRAPALGGRPFWARAWALDRSKIRQSVIFIWVKLGDNKYSRFTSYATVL